MPPVTKVGDKSDLVPTKEFPYAKYPFEFFNPLQSRVFDYYDKDNSCIIAAATSAGKAQPLDSPVLTPKGFVPMGELKVGDYAISQNLMPTPVTGVFPQGKKMVYRVVFSDGATCECCADHLWAVQTRSDKCRKRPFTIKPLKELFGDLKAGDGANKWYIPLVEYTHAGHKQYGDFFRQLPLDPYVLGVLLGDGGIKHRVILSTGDERILKEVEMRLPEGVLVDFLQDYDYQIVGGISEPGAAHGFPRTNLVKKILLELGLFGLGSCEKFIPETYLNADPVSRLELLRGLMDTDGNANGDHAGEFSSCSLKLAEGVCFLARSLGASTKVRRGKSSYRDGAGNLVECEARFRVTVNLGLVNPFWLSRKSEAQKLNLKKGRNRSINRIEVVGEKECQCISVGAVDNLYITNDFVVTHNTVCAEMFLSDAVIKRKQKGMYLAPLRALAQEKIDDWSDSNHHFSGLNRSICTGDYRLTAKRKKELEAADLVIMTSEMLNSRCRNFNEEKNGWLKDIQTLVVDESHLLTVPGRGDHLEAGLMKFTEFNPHCRIIFLSATMPNVDEISDWVSYILTRRDTCLITSTYRPCPLNIHYEKYWDGDSYEENEAQKVALAMQIVEYYPEDKFLIFTHTKRTGELMKKVLQKAKVECEYHNADLEKAKRVKVEKQFKEDPNLRVIVATSTLAWGLNLPARRVIVLGVHRGMDEVATYDIAQMVGRAGRPAYDPVGDAYVLLPEKTFDVHKARLKKPTPIQSQMLDEFGGKHKVLAFHLVSEIHQGNIQDKDDVHHWYKRSLAAFQANELDDKVVDDTLDLLKKIGAVWEEEGKLTVTSTGKIASLFYYSPFDVADMKKNFTQLFDSGREDDDYCLSFSLGNLDTHRCGIVSKLEREEMSRYNQQIKLLFPTAYIAEPAVKAGYAYYLLLAGNTNQYLAGYCRGLQFDFPRTCQVLQAVDSFTGKWNKKGWLTHLTLRMNYGVRGPQAYLCQLPHVGKVRANKLYHSGLRTIEEVANNPSQVRSLLNLKPEMVDEIISEAKRLSFLNAADLT